MPKNPSGGNVQTLRDRWKSPKRQRVLDKLFGQRCFADFAFPEVEEEDPTLIKDVRAADLSGRDLHDLLLTNADVRWADFTEARIQATFQHTHLAHADFGRAVLTGCRFWKARGINVRFERAALLRVHFEACSLFGANFRGAQLADTRFDDVDLTNADFSGAAFEGCTLRGARLNESQRAFWEGLGEARCELHDVLWCEDALAEA
jgi:uncharacterized protein YjbI with pentapeptide repeats